MTMNRMLGTVLALLACQGATAQAPLTNDMAFATRWESRVKLGHDMAQLGGSAFSISARFFPIYRVPHFGAVIGMSGPSGKFAIGQSLTFSNDPSWAKPALGLMLGGVETTFDADARLRLNQWNHLAVVFVPNKGWTLYLNALPIGSVPDNGFRASGELSLGRISELGKESQFYGLIDDVAVFDTALSPLEVRQQAARKALTGKEAGLKWGWRFNANADPINAQSNPPVIEGNAIKVGVSADRNASDAARMPAPVQALQYELPFPDDAEYYVVQSNNGNGHHWGNYAFTWDFIYAGSRADALALRKANGNFAATEQFNIKQGQGQPITAVADGSVVHANWEFVEGDGSTVPNATIVRHAQGEYSVYYHLKQGSFPALFPWASPKPPFTTSLAAFDAIDGGAIPDSYPKVNKYKPVGGLGGTGMGAHVDHFHLHFGVLDQLDLFHYDKRMSRPIHFAPFESSPDRIRWTTLSGVPEAGTYVRRKLSVRQQRHR